METIGKALNPLKTSTATITNPTRLPELLLAWTLQAASLHCTRCDVMRFVHMKLKRYLILYIHMIIAHSHKISHVHTAFKKIVILCSQHEASGLGMGPLRAET